MLFSSLAAAVLFLVFLFDIVVQRNWRRHALYRSAQRRAQQTGKPLLVIGANDLGGLSGSIAAALSLYGCGDVCLDLEGCPRCPHSSVTSSVESALPALPADSHVVFVSVVLEYVDDLPSVLAELRRVSGGDLFVVHIDNLLDPIWPSLGDYTDIKTSKTLKRKWRLSIRNGAVVSYKCV